MSEAFLSEGKRVALRALREADLEGDYAAWLNDPAVCRYNSHAVYPMMRAQLESYVRSAARDPGRLVLAIIDKADDRHIGNVTLQGMDPVQRTAELAILLGERAAWGKGCGREACELIVAHGFRRLNLHRVHCGTVAQNTAMRRIAAALGMREEGVRRNAFYLSGEYCDVHEFGLLRDEYLAR